MEDSEDEGEELLKQVKDRKQSIAKLNMSPQEKDLMKRLSTAGEGNLNLIVLSEVMDFLHCITRI